MQKISPNDRIVIAQLAALSLIMLFYVLNVLAGRPALANEILDISSESTVLTWFSSCSWYTAFALLTYTATKSVKNERLPWFVFALTSLLFSIDEVAMLHERIFSNLFLVVFPKNNPVSSWSVMAGPFVMIGVFHLWKFQRDLNISNNIKMMLFSGFAITALGGWGLEFTINFFPIGLSKWFWQIENILEESCEMVGCIFITRAALEMCRPEYSVA